MSIRVRGLLQFIGAGIIFAIVVYLFMDQQAADPHVILPEGPSEMIAFLTPGGFSLAGLVQFISGVPFSELSDKWNALAGWQRGVYGTLIFFAALAATMGLFMLCLLLVTVDR